LCSILFAFAYAIFIVLSIPICTALLSSHTFIIEKFHGFQSFFCHLNSGHE
jgi:hypothetical protein